MPIAGIGNLSDAQWDYIGCSAFFSLQNDRTSVRATTDITPQFKVSWLCASPICSVEDLARIFHGEPCKEKLECYSRRPREPYGH